MRRIGKILIWFLIAAWFFIVMGFVNSESDEIICNHVEIKMMDTIRHNFIFVSDIREILDSYDAGLQGYPVDKINLRKLEEMMQEIPYVKNAEVYSSISGKLNIDIYQRDAMIRIKPEESRGFYIDNDGYFLPLSERSSARTILATGDIAYPADLNEHPSILSFSPDQRLAFKNLIELHEFARYLSRHPLWSKQIVQVYLNQQGEYEIIPRVGAHQILMGSMENYEEKLRNLEMLYKQGLPKYGWNSYDIINIKYSNQVICTKR